MAHTRVPAADGASMNNPLYWAVVAGLFLTVLTPGIIAQSLLFPFITGKAIYFRSLVDIVVACYVLLAVREPRYRPKISLLSVTAAAFVVVVLVADLFGVNPHRSFWSNFERMEGFVTILHLWMFFVVAGTVMGTQLWCAWMTASIATSMVVSMYGLFQAFGIITFYQDADRVDSTMGNSGQLAIYLLVNIGFAVYLIAARYGGRWASWLYGVTTLFNLFILFRTATRGTLLALIVGVVAAAAIFAWQEKRRTPGRYLAMAMLAIVVLSGPAFYAIKDMPFARDNPTVRRVVNTKLQNTRISFMWPMALQGIAEKPVLGYGQDGFNYVYARFYDSRLWADEPWWDRAHNAFLDWFVAAGVFGFLLYAALYVLALLAIWRGPFHLHERAVLIGLVVAYGTHSLTLFDTIPGYVMFFALLAFVHSRVATAYAFPAFTVPGHIRDFVIAPVVMIGMTLGLYYFNIVPYRLGALVLEAAQPQGDGLGKNLALYQQALAMPGTGSQEVREQAIQFAGKVIRTSLDPEMRQAFLHLAQTAIDAQTAYSPLDPRGFHQGGTFLTAVGQFEKGYPLLVRAHQLTPRKQEPMLDLVVNLLSQKRFAEAAVVAKDAFDLDPEFPRARRTYLTALVSADDTAAFEAYLLENLPNDPDPQLVALMIDNKRTRLLPVVFRHLIARHPRDLTLRTSLATAHLLNQDVPGAIAVIEQAMTEFTYFQGQGKRLIADIRAGKDVLKQ